MTLEEQLKKAVPDRNHIDSLEAVVSSCTKGNYQLAFKVYSPVCSRSRYLLNNFTNIRWQLEDKLQKRHLVVLLIFKVTLPNFGN